MQVLSKMRPATLVLDDKQFRSTEMIKVSISIYVVQKMEDC